MSFSRILVGFSLATLIGVPLGLLAGTFVVGRQLIAEASLIRVPDINKRQKDSKTPDGVGIAVVEVTPA
jgi:hypothetical protein